MTSAQTLSTLALRRLRVPSHGEPVDLPASGPNGHENRPLVQALQVANEWTWDTVEVMLAGKRLCEWAKEGPSEFHGRLTETVDALLGQVAPEEFRRADPDWRQTCWQQLRAVRAAGLLAVAPPSAPPAVSLLSDRHESAEREVLDRLADTFERSGWYCLRPLLEMRTWQGEPFVVVLFAWFTRQALKTNVTDGLPLDLYEWGRALDLMLQLFKEHPIDLAALMREACGDRSSPLIQAAVDTMAASLRFQRGLACIQNGEYERAIPEFSVAIQHNPSMEHAYAQRGDAHRMLGAYDRALSDYTAALRLNPGNAMALLNRGQTQRLLGRPDRAIVDYDLALQLDPDSVVALNHRGNAHADVGDHKSAITDFTRALQIDPNYPFSYQNRARSYTARGELDAAIADYGQVLQLNPVFTLAYVRRADAYRQKGELSRAIADYTDALRLDPLQLTAYVNRGTAYQQQKEPRRALADFEAALRLDSTNPRLYLNRGITYREGGSFKQALADFDAAQELEPDNPQIFLQRALTYQEQGNTEWAIADLDEAIRLKPDAADALFHRGTLRVLRREPDQAIADLDEVIRLNPGMPSAFLSRARAHALKEQLDEVIEDCTRALALDATLSRAYLTRGTAFFRQKNYEEALADFDHALKLLPQDAEALIDRGIVRSRMGDHKAAIADFTRALQITPRNARAYAARGSSNRDQNRHEVALADFTHAVMYHSKYGVFYTNQRGLIHVARGEYEQAIADCTLSLLLHPGNRRALLLREQALEARRLRDQNRQEGASARSETKGKPTPETSPQGPASSAAPFDASQMQVATEGQIPTEGTYEVPTFLQDSDSGFEMDFSGLNLLPLPQEQESGANEQTARPKIPTPKKLPRPPVLPSQEVDLRKMQVPTAALTQEAIPAAGACELTIGEDASAPAEQAEIEIDFSPVESVAPGDAAEAERETAAEAKRKREEEAQRRQLREDLQRRMAEEARKKIELDKRKRLRRTDPEDREAAAERWERRKFSAAVALVVLVIGYFGWDYIGPPLNRMLFSRRVPTVTALEFAREFAKDPRVAEKKWSKKLLCLEGKIVSDDTPRPGQVGPRYYFELPADQDNLPRIEVVISTSDDDTALETGISYRIIGVIQPPKVGSDIELKNAAVMARLTVGSQGGS